MGAFQVHKNHLSTSERKVQCTKLFDVYKSMCINNFGVIIFRR